ncbi:hypothetical protein [Natrinema sp. DC36]|uniref:hypothetical protein n=1 Tax=Natrinema sp. DC36 TaxID=2878680 RepID=UPI001CF09590|nr:hypothetical protein [Natrinema sp. DC36]
MAAKNATQNRTDFEPLTADTAPEDFQILSVFDLVPDDIKTTPPATAKLLMSPEFTNPRGADADRGKTRDYVIVLEYPARVENTVVKMNDCPTHRGSRLFRGFLENVADDKGYTLDSQQIDDYL